MPTLIRLIVALLFLVGLGYGALYALTVMVDPGVKEITVKIPPRDLNPQAADSLLPTVITTSPPATPAPPASPAPAP
ncbi:MAG TPA: hypothetical protein VGM83_00795 [Devosiaceae bacterium]|jgi:hypothetical protein